MADTSLNPINRPVRSDASWLVFFAIDSLVILASVALAYVLRYLVVWPGFVGAIIREVPTAFYVSWDAFIPIGVVLLLLMQVQFAVRGMYRLPANVGWSAHLRIIFNSTTAAAAVLIIIVFAYRPLYYSRLVIAFALVLTVILLSLVRLILVLILRVRWARGIGRERYLVVGGGDISHAVMAGIVARPHLGYALVGYLADGHDPGEGGGSAQPLHFHYLGAIDDISAVLATHHIDHGIIA